MIIKAGRQLLIKSVEDFDENIEEDLEFARRTEEAWERYDKGEFHGPFTVDEFKKRMKSW